MALNMAIEEQQQTVIATLTVESKSTNSKTWTPSGDVMNVQLNNEITPNYANNKERKK